MRRTPIFAAGLVIAVMTATGCDSTKVLKKENVLLKEENTTLRAQLDDRNAALETSNQELRDREVQLAELRQQMTDLESRPSGTTGFEGIAGVSGEIGAGEITAIVESDILFDPGRATLKSAAKASLDAVAAVLNNSYGSKTIRISGHTDTDPIRKSGHKSNYHLGFERAYAVREYLISRGVSRDRIYLASYGPDEPRGSSKKQNRRVEIVVVMNG